MAGGERTEAPTPRRREEARRRGEVPRSAELTAVLGLLAGTFALRYAGASVVDKVSGLMSGTFRTLSAQEWTINTTVNYGGWVGATYLAVMAPLFVALMAVGIAGNVAQSGVVLSTRTLSPDLSRIDPLKGLQRVFSQRSLVELIKSLIKISIVGYVVYQALQSKYAQMISLSGSDIRGVLSIVIDIAFEIILQAGLALLMIAFLDYGYQRWQYERNIRMTKEEVKEEMRQSEGDPKVKGKIRQRQRQIASRRMMHDVPASDVVITNPTHYAVALQYRPETMRAPKVTAKGQLLIAERIKEIAREYGVPIIENKPLAKALYDNVEVGAEIPPMLYHAVAEVLAFIYRLKRERRLGVMQNGR